MQTVTQYTLNHILEMEVMTCNLAKIILQPSTGSFSEKNLSLAVLIDNFNQFHCSTLKNIPAKELLQIQILNGGL